MDEEGSRNGASLSEEAQCRGSLGRAPLLGTPKDMLSKALESGFGGLWVACWPLVPKFPGSNPAESSARLPSEGK
jgi:hypothetical protein